MYPHFLDPDKELERSPPFQSQVLIGFRITLNNSQGVGNVNGALTYEGKLPTNYNIIINSSSNYGKLSVTSGTDSLIFGIHNTSNVTSGTYQDVLTGISTLSSLTGTYGAYNWTLASRGINYDLTIE